MSGAPSPLAAPNSVTVSGQDSTAAQAAKGAAVTQPTQLTLDAPFPNTTVQAHAIAFTPTT